MGKRKHHSTESSSSGGSAEDRKVHKHKHKKHKKEKKEKKAKKEVDKQKLAEAKRLVQEGKLRAKQQEPEEVPVSRDLKINTLTEDDYFSRNVEFTLWLKERRQVFFNDLPADEARQLFAEFVAAWNNRKLSHKYYTGHGLAMRRTNHQWNIKGEAALPSGGLLGMAAARDEAHEADMASTAQRRAETALDRKRWNADQKQQLDELLPRATGREALIEKKAARREAARDRDASPDMTRLVGGGDIMGGDDSFQAARAREAQQRQRRAMQQASKADSLAHRATAAAAKEDDRMASFRALAAAGPITIPKRL